MKTDFEISKAISAGQRNQETIKLIQNWCRHARVEGSAGGFVAMQTRLPIGHFGMGCDHASAGGMAAWDLAEAAIDFHDRNCMRCTQRVPVGLPSISTLIDRRNAERDQMESERRRTTKIRAEEQDRRTQYRHALKQKQPAASICILEFIEDLDRKQDEQAREKLLGMAKLAPDAFTPEIVEYCFALIEQSENWFYDTGLELLGLVASDSVRRARCAMHCLASHSAIPLASTIVMNNPSAIEERDLPGALPALVWRAEPERSDFFHEDRRVHDPLPLITVCRKKQAATQSAITKALDSRNPYQVSVAARAIAVLAESNDLQAGAFARTLIAKLTRPHLLMDLNEEMRHQNEEVVNRLQLAFSYALEDSPELTDKLAADFLASASAEGEERIYKAYTLALAPGRREDKKRKSSISAQEVVLRRLINVLSSSKDYEVLQLIRGAFDYPSDSVLQLGRKELSTLLGAAIMLDDRLAMFEDEQKTLKPGLELMEHSNLRNVVDSVQGALLKWAVSSAASDSAATAQFLDVFRRLPEGSDAMRAAMISELHHLVTTPAGLNAVLPYLHSAMVSTSTLQRASASGVLQHLSRARSSDIPDLLFETFAMHLSDCYVLVHKTAVRTLEYIVLPPGLLEATRVSLWNIITCYAEKKSEERFLVECIKVFLRRFDSEGSQNMNLRRILVALLGRVRPDIIERDLHWLSLKIGDVDDFSRLIIKALEHSDSSSHRQDGLLRALDSLSNEKIKSHAGELVAIATANLNRLQLSVSIVETLSKAGLWNEVVHTCRTLHDLLPDNVRFEYQKLNARLRLIASQYEAAIAAGDVQQLSPLALVWKDTENKIAKLQSKNAERRHSFLGLSGPYRSG